MFREPLEFPPPWWSLPWVCVPVRWVLASTCPFRQATSLGQVTFAPLQELELQVRARFNPPVGWWRLRVGEGWLVTSTQLVTWVNTLKSWNLKISAKWLKHGNSFGVFLNSFFRVSCFFLMHLDLFVFFECYFFKWGFYYMRYTSPWKSHHFLENILQPFSKHRTCKSKNMFSLWTAKCWTASSFSF